MIGSTEPFPALQRVIEISRHCEKKEERIVTCVDGVEAEK